MSLVLAALQFSSQGKQLAAPPPHLSQSGFYSQAGYVRGLPIIASSKVDPRSIFTLIDRIQKMTQNIPDQEFKLLVKGGSYFAIIGANQRTTDLPEYADLRHDPNMDWNARARGFGGKMTSAGEENILELPGDRYKGESIYVHEFAHTLASQMFEKYDKSFKSDLESAFRHAKLVGLWAKTYSATNADEYFAEGVQCYFDCCRRAKPANGVHNWVGNRKELQTYDSALFALIDRSYHQNPWRYEGTYNTTTSKI